MPAAKKQRVAAGPAATYGPDDPLPVAPKQPHKLTKKELRRPDPKDAVACKKFLPEFAKRLTVRQHARHVCALLGAPLFIKP